MRKTLVAVWAAAMLALGAPHAFADGSLKGTVRNGTTGKPAGGVSVVLLQLQGGMEAVADTKTDGEGRFHLENPNIGRQPMLVRAIYHGVNFHQPAPPGRDTVDVEVFESSKDEKTMSVASRYIVFQPNGDKLLVGEQYSIENKSKPPVSYFKADGNFEFQIPEHAELQQVAAWGPSGMPVVQGTMDRGANRYAIAYAFHPGQGGVRVSYVMPYPSSEATVRIFSPYATGQLGLGAPPTVQVNSPGFQPAGTEQGMNLYAREAVPAGALLDVTVSGTAPPQAASEQQSTTGETQQIQAMPNRLETLKWPLIGGFVVLFAMGAFILWRQPAPSAAPGVDGAATVPPRPVKSKKRDSAAATRAVEQLDQQVGVSLDALKDTLFRLELRRQAGTIGEDEYARERARVEQMLRDLVKG
jgi:hypothetical protein